MSSALCPLRIDLRAIAGSFHLYGSFVDGAPYGSGHINDTYAVRFDQAGTPVRYILQRINSRVFRDVPGLMENIQRVTEHAAHARATGRRDSIRRVLTLVPTRAGGVFHRDAEGNCWRCYLLIEKAHPFDLVENPRQAFEAARPFGEFQRALVDLPGPRLNETIPGFHDTRRRLETLKRTMAANPRDRVAKARAELDFVLSREAMVDVLLDLQERGEIPERITHNDTKFNNVLLDESTNEAVCVVDLDTVMPGLALYDFGDMVRSATNSALEDERDLSKVAMRMPIYEGLVSGYLASAGSFLTPAERAHLAFSGKLITLEIGLRFLTDYLEGDVYFKTRSPDHNLDRCRNQFALVRSIEQHESAMQCAAERIIKVACES
jgi:hypothetical protein